MVEFRQANTNCAALGRLPTGPEADLLLCQQRAGGSHFSPSLAATPFHLCREAAVVYICILAHA